MSREPLSDTEYAEMAADYAANPPRTDEAIGPVDINYAHPDVILAAGRPKGGGGSGRTPTTSVRLPADMKARLQTQAATESVRPAEIIRRALAEYFDRHSA